MSKVTIQYISACAMLVSSVALAFLSFFLNHYDIEAGILVYIAQCLLFVASVFGVNLILSQHGQANKQEF